MPTFHVMTVTPSLPHRLLDQVMTGIERTLHEAGATHVWISDELPRLAVMADLPLEAPEPRKSA